MTSLKRQLASLDTAYELQKRGDDDIHVLNEQHPLHDKILNAQHALNDLTGTFELDYDIMHDACITLSSAVDNESIDISKLDDIEAEEMASDASSIYTATRLSYLNNINQAEISDILHDFGKSTDIATACAVWYERQVAEAIRLIIKELNK